MISAALIALEAVAITSGLAERDKSISIDVGRPLHTADRGVRIDFNGQDSLVIRTAGRTLKLKAMAPAQLSVSPSAAYLAHNFGDGSGQVYDLRLYELRTGRTLSIVAFKRRTFAFAESIHSCKPRPDEISYLAGRWLSISLIEVRTEDWTRRPGCGHLARKWTLAVP